MMVFRRQLFQSGKKLTFPVKVCLFIASLLLVVGVLKVGQAAWQEPSDEPTGGGIYSPPITTSATEQTKAGGLEVVGSDTDGSLETKAGLEVASGNLFIDNDLNVANGDLTVGSDALFIDASARRVAINDATGESSTSLWVSGRGHFVSSGQASSGGIEDRALVAEYLDSNYDSNTKEETVYIENDSATDPAVLGTSLSTSGGGGVLGKGGDLDAAGESSYAILADSGSGQGENYAAEFSDVVAVDNFRFYLTDDLDIARYDHTATLLNDGRVLITGGWTGANFTDPTETAEIYNPATGQFIPTTTDMTSPRANHYATLLADGRVLISGGYDADNKNSFINTGEYFDPDDNSFTPLGFNLSSMAEGTATLLSDGRIAFIGGAWGTGSGDVYNDAYLCDLVNESCVIGPGSGLSDGKKNHTSTLYKSEAGTDYILVAGGESGSVHASADIYRVGSINQTTSLGNMPGGRTRHTATLLENGKVLLAGGRDLADNRGNNGYLFDPSGPNITDIGDTMQNGRYAHDAVTLESGLVLISGGSVTGKGMDVYDYVSNSFIDPLDDANDQVLIAQLTTPEFNPPQLNVIRQGHTMTLLLNGRTLIVGGIDPNTTLVSATEITEAALQVGWSSQITNLKAEFLDGHREDEFVTDDNFAALFGNVLENQTAADQKLNFYLSGQGIFEGGLESDLNVDDLYAMTATNNSDSGGYGVKVQAADADSDETTYGVYGTAVSGANTARAAYFEGRVQIETDKIKEGSFINAGNFDYSISGQAGTALANGQVFMAGGDRGNGADNDFVNDSYAYDPSSGSISSQLAMPTARTGHQVTNIGNGKWWNPFYQYRRQIEISAVTDDVPAGHGVYIDTDVEALVAEGKVRSDYKDWRVVYWDGDGWEDIGRDYLGHRVSSQTWFTVQEVIASGSSDDNYYIYYGNSEETTESGTSGAVVSFDDYTLASYGSLDIDVDQYEVLDSGYTLKLWGNNWKVVNYFSDTSDSELNLDFKSVTTQGEKNGIGFDSDMSNAVGDWDNYYQLFGTDAADGNIAAPYYSGSGNYENFQVDLNSGVFNYLHLANNNDGSGEAEIYYSNVKVFPAVTNEPSVSVQSEETRLANYALVTGGYASSDGEAIDSAEEWRTVSWPSYSMILPRTNHTATLLLNGEIFVAGGFDNSLGGDVVTNTELFKSGSFSAGPAMPSGQARGNHTATLLKDGRVFIVGGSSSPTSGYLSKGLIYNSQTELITETNSSFNLMVDHSTILLPSGQILVAGGCYEGDAWADAVLYDPDTDAATALPDLNTARCGHSASLLPGGRVLLAGGRDGSNYLSSYEIYDPHIGDDGGFVQYDSPFALDENRADALSVGLDTGQVVLSGGVNEFDKLNTVKVFDPYQPPFKTKTGAQRTANLNASYLDGYAASAIADSSADLTEYLTVQEDLTSPQTGTEGIVISGSLYADQEIEVEQSAGSGVAVLSQAGLGSYGLYAQGEAVAGSKAIWATNATAWAGYFERISGYTTKTQITGNLSLANGVTHQSGGAASRSYIAAGISSRSVTNPRVSPSSIVLVTMTDSGGASQYFSLEVINKGSSSFTVRMDPAVSHGSPVWFDYLIIN
ncbi:MAG: hypothetical protein ABIB97_02675 [Patescibacteria group bacterium]